MSATEDYLGTVRARFDRLLAERPDAGGLYSVLAGTIRDQAAEIGRADTDGVVFMRPGEAVDAGTQWCVFVGGDGPGDCAWWQHVDDQVEAEERVQWLTSGGHAYRRVDYGPWVVMQPEANMAADSVLDAP